MKLALHAILLLTCSVLAFPQASETAKTKEKPKTLGAFKREFLNQDIIVNDVSFQRDRCLEWNAAKQKSDSTYEEKDALPNLPFSYKGQTARVVAVQIAKSFLSHATVGGTNAFGESVGEDDIDDPYMEVVVRFKDDKLAMIKGYTITLVPEKMELASKRQTVQDKLESMLPTVIGQKLYAVAFSRMYKPTAAIEQMSGSEEIFARLSITDVPLLQPLTITKAKYLPDVNAVVMKLALSNGTEAIAYTPSQYLRLDDPKGSFLSGISGTLLSSMPKDLTAKEIDAIRGMKVFRGMSKDALGYAVGFTEKENDWGRGGKQLIYFDGKLVVYLDNSEKVEDWQSLD